jgi:hypothetical protein
MHDIIERWVILGEIKFLFADRVEFEMLLLHPSCSWPPSQFPIASLVFGGDLQYLSSSTGGLQQKTFRRLFDSTGVGQLLIRASARRPDHPALSSMPSSCVEAQKCPRLNTAPRVQGARDDYSKHIHWRIDSFFCGTPVVCRVPPQIPSQRSLKYRLRSGRLDRSFAERRISTGTHPSAFPNHFSSAQRPVISLFGISQPSPEGIPSEDSAHRSRFEPLKSIINTTMFGA